MRLLSPGEPIERDHWFFHYRLKCWAQIESLGPLGWWMLGCGWHDGFSKIYVGAPKFNQQTATQPPFGGASGSARQCYWLIGEGRLAALCPGKATHIDPLTGTLFCESHAEDYEDVFGAALQTLSPNAPASATGQEGKQ